MAALSTRNGAESVELAIERLGTLDGEALRIEWRNLFGRRAPRALPKSLLVRALAYRFQALEFGDVDPHTLRVLEAYAAKGAGSWSGRVRVDRLRRTKQVSSGPGVKPGSILVREWAGERHRVTALEIGFAWNGATYRSLSEVARAITGTRSLSRANALPDCRRASTCDVFGLSLSAQPKETRAVPLRAAAYGVRNSFARVSAHGETSAEPRLFVGRIFGATSGPALRRVLRCAIYTRVSTDQGLEQDFNSLDAQREACAAYIRSQAHESWVLIPTQYDDGGYSGGNLDRPALRALLKAVAAKRIDVIVVYKVDRLTRSLADFAKLVEAFDAAGVSFISITQSFNTTTSMGRLTLNMLLSFAQFEREVTGERIRDKIAASKKSGVVPLGYRVVDRKLIVDEAEAKTVQFIFSRYLELGSLGALIDELRQNGVVTRVRTLATGRVVGGVPCTARDPSRKFAPRTKTTCAALSTAPEVSLPPRLCRP